MIWNSHQKKIYEYIFIFLIEETSFKKIMSKGDTIILNFPTVCTTFDASLIIKRPKCSYYWNLFSKYDRNLVILIKFSKIYYLF